MHFIELTTYKGNPILINPEDVFFIEEVLDGETDRYTLICFRSTEASQATKSLMVKDNLSSIRAKLFRLGVNSQ